MKLFLDLDGVLVDFVKGALAAHGFPADSVVDCWDFDKKLGIPPERFWEPFGEQFWANLDWMADGMDILHVCEAFFKPEDIFLCSSPCRTAGCLEGKRQWVRKHLPTFERRLILTPAKQVFARHDHILVDDADHNVDSFRQAGGYAILIPRLWNRNCDLSRTPPVLLGNLFRDWISPC